ncbi:MAG: 2-oxo acid dehydrogenase subunit E2 [Chloroflexi bacterium]|nr:MAG: 2-oxo acid dehydrogenase subunit E2 [Chloroflexota bacterium]
MPIPFIMPKFDMDQEKAVIGSWLKKEGDLVQADEAVLVVETDKIAIEVTAPASGILAGVCAKEGDVVPVTQVIAYILKDGEKLAAPNQVAVGTPPTAVQKEPDGPDGRGAVLATPVAARMAKEQGIDLSQVKASGERISRTDIERYLENREKENTHRVTTPATPKARRLAEEAGVELGKVLGTGPRGRVQAADVIAADAAEQAPITKVATAKSERPVRILPLSSMRRTIAERMQASFQTAPHISLTVEVDVTRLEEVRGRLNVLAEKSSHSKVSFTALLVRICAWALERHPALISSFQDHQIYQWLDVNIGIATAVKDGLIVPVIRQANCKPVHQIVEELQDLASRAKSGKLTLAEVQEGTFTISNLGMFGILQFRPIINPPESAILAVGKVTRKPVVINDQDEVAVRPIVSLTLAADHRLVDGVAAARFLEDLTQAIEEPEALLY